MPGAAATAAARPSTTQAITTPLAMVVTIRVARARRIGVVVTAIPGRATTTVGTGIENLRKIAAVREKRKKGQVTY